MADLMRTVHSAIWGGEANTVPARLGGENRRWWGCISRVFHKAGAAKWRRSPESWATRVEKPGEGGGSGGVLRVGFEASWAKPSESRAPRSFAFAVFVRAARK